MQVTQGDTGEQASVTRAPHEHNQESSKTRDPASDGPATRAGNAVKSKLVRGCRSGRNGSERSEGASRCGPFGPHAVGWGVGGGAGGGAALGRLIRTSKHSDFRISELTR